MAEEKNFNFRVGDEVAVHFKIKEGNKMKTQVFEGIVIRKRREKEAGGSFTVRKISHGVGVEKTFPLHSPNLEKVRVLKRWKTRRAKLYFLRERKSIRLKKKLNEKR